MKTLKSCSSPILRDYFRSHPEAIGVRVKGQSKSIDGCRAPESVCPLSTFRGLGQAPESGGFCGSFAEIMDPWSPGKCSSRIAERFGTEHQTGVAAVPDFGDGIDLQDSSKLRSPNFLPLSRMGDR
jgi:hypothetical protein